MSIKRTPNTIETVKLCVSGGGLLCLAPLSTIFQPYRGGFQRGYDLTIL